MRRIWMILVMAAGFIVMLGASAHGGGKTKEKPKDFKFEGTLEKDDAKDPKRNTPAKIHTVTFKKGQSYKIDLAGIGFDAFLRLEDDAGKELAEDDDSGGNLNAQIIFNCPKDGDYKIYCTCFATAGGKYVLTVKSVGIFTASAAHAALLDKPAPDFEGDFALNGNTNKMSELKGKVVLLHFWAVQSAGSVKTFARVREWRKRHQDAGLEVIGVTYFNSELGHTLGFDAESGKLKEIDKADTATDKALLKEFAAHHKLDHVLLTLSKEKALKTFDDYLVNGLPQVVLIDRKGIVRHAYMGDAQIRGTDVDLELKKLLAEK
jgi:peroxiredoxin